MGFLIGFAIAAGMATLYFGQQKHDKRLRDGTHVDENYIANRMDGVYYRPDGRRMTNKEKRARIIATALADRAAR